MDQSVSFERIREETLVRLTLNSLLDWTLIASNGVVSGSGPSMAKGRFVEM